MNIADIENLDAVLLVASNVRKEQPMLNHRIRKAALKGAKVMCVNARELEFNYPVEAQLVADPVAMIDTLAAIAKAAGAKAPKGLEDLFDKVSLDDSVKSVVKSLKDADKTAVFVGSTAVQHPAYSVIQALSSLIAEKTGATLGFIAESANTAGAWLAGAVPHRQEAGVKAKTAGKNAAQMIQSGMKAYVLLDVEPEFDCDNPEQANKAVNSAEFVVAITPYTSTTLLENADIILPSTGFGESSGTYVNAEGTWQSFRAAAKAFGDSRPAWKILRVLGNTLGVQGFDYVSSSDVKNELKIICDAADMVCHSFDVSGDYQKPEKAEKTDGVLQRLGDVAMYGGDSLVRRATALQKSLPGQENIYLNTAEMSKLGFEADQKVTVKQGDSHTKMTLALDDSIPDGCALIYSGTQASALLGSAFGTIELTV